MIEDGSSRLNEVLFYGEAKGIRFNIDTAKNKWGNKRSIGLKAPYGFMFNGHKQTRLIYVAQPKHETDDLLADRIEEWIHKMVECDQPHSPTAFTACDECNYLVNLWL